MDSGYDYHECIGLKVKPRQGDGLLFYSLFPNGKIDKVIFHFVACMDREISFKPKGDKTSA